MPGGYCRAAVDGHRTVSSHGRVRSGDSALPTIVNEGAPPLPVVYASCDAWRLAKRTALDPAPPLPAAVVFCAICWGQSRILSPAANGEGVIPVVCAHCEGDGAVPSRAA
jgi:hypothetical protein